MRHPRTGPPVLHRRLPPVHLNHHVPCAPPNRFSLLDVFRRPPADGRTPPPTRHSDIGQRSRWWGTVPSPRWHIPVGLTRRHVESRADRAVEGGRTASIWCLRAMQEVCEIFGWGGRKVSAAASRASVRRMIRFGGWRMVALARRVVRLWRRCLISLTRIVRYPGERRIVFIARRIMRLMRRWVSLGAHVRHKSPCVFLTRRVLPPGRRRMFLPPGVMHVRRW